MYLHMHYTYIHTYIYTYVYTYICASTVVWYVIMQCSVVK